MKTDAVILAAGRGERLSDNGIAAPYLKPLLPVNGRPLVRNAVQVAHQATSRTPVVVVAPENALPIAQVLHGLPATLVVQRAATGPGDALLLAMQLVTADNVLVLMSDNVLSAVDVQRVLAPGVHRASVGVRSIAAPEAERFTYRVPTPFPCWVEKVPVDATTTVVDDVVCWVGPLVLPSNAVRAVLKSGHGSLGPPLLNAFTDAELRCVPVDTVDVGTPSMWEAT